MISFVKLTDKQTASVYVRKGKKGVHMVEIWTPRHTVNYEVNRKDLPVGQRRKKDIVDIAIQRFQMNEGK